MTEPARAGSPVRALAVLLIAGLATIGLVAGPAVGAGKALTKSKAKRLFYTRAKADARFINLGEQASDSDRVDGLDAARMQYEATAAGEIELLNAAGLRIAADCNGGVRTRFSTDASNASYAYQTQPSGGALDEDLGPSPGLFLTLPGSWMVRLSFTAPSGRHVDAQWLQVSPAGSSGGCLVDGTAMYREG